MAQRFTTTIYFQLLAALTILLSALLATWGTSAIVIPALQRWNIRSMGLEPQIEVAKITASDVTRPWKPVAAQSVIPTTTAPTLADLFPPQYPNAPFPFSSAKANELEVKLFYSLMYYGHPAPEYAGKRLTHEFDAETGYGRVISEPYEEIHADYLSYLDALELHHLLHPEIALFDGERAKVRALAPQILSTVSSREQVLSTPRAPSTESYWLARRLADLTGDAVFTSYADTYGDGLAQMGTGYANLVADGAPRTLYASHFLLPAVMHDMAQRTSNPELQRKAGELMQALITDLYDPISRTVFNDYGSNSGPGSDTREANDTFDAISGLWKYYELSADGPSGRLAQTLSQGFAISTTQPSPLINNFIDIYRLYATKNEQGTLMAGDQVSSALNLRALAVIQQLNVNTDFGPHDQDFAMALDMFEQKFYDENSNGFAWGYHFEEQNQEYTPVETSGHRLNSIRIASRLTSLILADKYARKQALDGGAPPVASTTSLPPAESAASDPGASTTSEAATADAAATGTE